MAKEQDPIQPPNLDVEEDFETLLNTTLFNLDDILQEKGDIQQKHKYIRGAHSARNLIQEAEELEQEGRFADSMDRLKEVYYESKHLSPGLQYKTVQRLADASGKAALQTESTEEKSAWITTFYNWFTKYKETSFQQFPNEILYMNILLAQVRQEQANTMIDEKEKNSLLTTAYSDLASIEGNLPSDKKFQFSLHVSLKELAKAISLQVPEEKKKEWLQIYQEETEYVIEYQNPNVENKVLHNNFTESIIASKKIAEAQTDREFKKKYLSRAYDRVTQLISFHDQLEISPSLQIRDISDRLNIAHELCKLSDKKEEVYILRQQIYEQRKKLINLSQKHAYSFTEEYHKRKLNSDLRLIAKSAQKMAQGETNLSLKKRYVTEAYMANRETLTTYESTEDLPSIHIDEMQRVISLADTLYQLSDANTEPEEAYIWSKRRAELREKLIIFSASHGYHSVEALHRKKFIADIKENIKIEDSEYWRSKLFTANVNYFLFSQEHPKYAPIPYSLESISEGIQILEEFPFTYDTQIQELYLKLRKVAFSTIYDPVRLLTSLLRQKTSENAIDKKHPGETVILDQLDQQISITQAGSSNHKEKVISREEKAGSISDIPETPSKNQKSSVFKGNKKQNTVDRTILETGIWAIKQAMMDYPRLSTEQINSIFHALTVENMTLEQLKHSYAFATVDKKLRDTLFDTVSFTDGGESIEEQKKIKTLLIYALFPSIERSVFRFKKYFEFFVIPPEDVFQEIWGEHIPKVIDHYYKDPSPVLNFAKIAQMSIDNKCKDIIRKAKQRPETVPFSSYFVNEFSEEFSEEILAALLPTHDLSIEERYLLKEEVAETLLLLQKLSPKHRDLLINYAIKERSFTEIAEELGKTRDNATNTVKYAIKKLKEVKQLYEKKYNTTT